MEELGAVSPNDVDTAEGQIASTQADLVVSETNLREQEVQLKNVLSRRGALDPQLETVHIVTLDRIEVPEVDNLPALKDLVASAMENRSDLASARLNVTSSEISAVGTKNGVLPTLEPIGGVSQAGLAGPVGLEAACGANSYFVGGIGTALGQTFRQQLPHRAHRGILPSSHRQPAGTSGLWNRPASASSNPAHNAEAIQPGIRGHIQRIGGDTAG